MGAVLDHVFNDAIGALRDAFGNAFLERQAFDEHFQSDILTGDLTWETSYGIPGEGHPPRVVTHVTLVWPAWSQATYRAWYVDEIFHEPPSIDLEIVYRVQRLSAQPDAGVADEITPPLSPKVGTAHLERESATIEIARVTHPEERDDRVDHALEVTYRGVYELAEQSLADGSSTILDEHFAALGSWIASTLVKLGDLRLAYHPADDDAAG